MPVEGGVEKILGPERLPSAQMFHVKRPINETPGRD